MKYLILILMMSFIISVVAASCKEKSEKTVVFDKLDRDTTLVFKTNKYYPTTSKIEITGYANDSFRINGTGIKGGNVDTSWHFDWFSKSVIFHYESFKAKSGKLRVKIIQL